jgi:AraC-like DNA-binding protein
MNVNVEFKEPGEILKPYINYYLFTEIIANNNPFDDSNYRLINIPDSEIELHIGYHETTSEFGFIDQKSGVLRSAIVGANDLNYTMSIVPCCMVHKNVIIKFKQRGFYEVFGIPLSELMNSVYNAEQIIGNGMFPLYDQVDHAADNTERVTCLETFLIRNLLANHKINPSYDRLDKAIEIIRRNKGLIALPDLIGFIGVSERPLQRDFKTFLGITPKQLCCMMRIQYLLSALEKQNLDECDLAYKFGYYDQAHMINEFKKATTLTPYNYTKHRNKEVFRALNTLIISGKVPDDPLCNDIVSAAERSFKSFCN